MQKKICEITAKSVNIQQKFVARTLQKFLVYEMNSWQNHSDNCLFMLKKIVNMKENLQIPNFNLQYIP